MNAHPTPLPPPAQPVRKRRAWLLNFALVYPTAEAVGYLAQRLLSTWPQWLQGVSKVALICLVLTWTLPWVNQRAAQWLRG